MSAVVRDQATGLVGVLVVSTLKEKTFTKTGESKHGKSEIVDLFLGSMTKHLLLDAPCDVLVIPPGREAKP